MALFPEIEPFNKFYLNVPGGHELYVEECGNPDGQPAVVLHGGPGAGITPKMRRFFDPGHWRVVLFDQRGAGRSRPHAGLENNTTWDLVADVERVREKLGIQKWLAFGGSWGSTLALAYAETHPDSVSHLVLRGIFLCRRAEIEWFYQSGAHWIFPDLWEKYLEPIPPSERGELVNAFYRRLTSNDRATRMAAAKAWSGWEGGTLRLLPDPETYGRFTEDEMAEALARIECHYFVNGAFFRADDQLLQDAWKVRQIPTSITHGRYDVVCPVKNAFDLHRVLPEARLEIIPDAGHAADEPGILASLIANVERFKQK